MRDLLVVGEAEETDVSLCKTLLQVHPAYTYLCFHGFDPDAVSNGSLVVALGKKTLEKVLERKGIKITDLYGQEIPVQRLHTNFSVVPHFHPLYVQRMQHEKGGASEKVLLAWFDLWDYIQELCSGQVVDPPDVSTFTVASDVIFWLSQLLLSTEHVAYDYETWGADDDGTEKTLRPELCTQFEILSVGVATLDGAFSFPLDHPRAEWAGDGFTRAKIAELWMRVVERGGTAHNAKYEHKCNLRRFGRSGPLRCTYLMDNALNELADHRLHRVMHSCGIRWSHYKTVADSIRKSPRVADLQALLRYNALDALGTAMIDRQLQVRLLECGERLERSARTEEQFCYRLAQLEMTGIQLDQQQVIEERVHHEQLYPQMLGELRGMPEIVKVERWAEKNIPACRKGAVFNPKSNPMMKRLCIDVLRLPVRPKRREHGEDPNSPPRYCLNKQVLSSFEEQVPVLGKLREMRSVSTMLSGFLNKWQAFADRGGLVHSQYNQAKVVTGRLSSSDPPQQNIPKKHRVRKVYVSRFRGGCLINGDFVQQEPRLLAGWSGDERMIDAINGGLNLHGYVASEIFHVEYQDKQTKFYEIGKRMNLGIMYGQTCVGLAAKTGITVEEAEGHLKKYDRLFPKVTQRRLAWHQEAMRYGFVEDLFGGRRRLPEAQSNDARMWVRGRALRQAGNFPIQKTAYVFTMISMAKAMEEIENSRDPEAMCVCMTVHDSLVGDAADGYRDELLDILHFAMTDVHNTAWYWRDSGVPMAADFSVGPNLYELQEVQLSAVNRS